MDIPYTWTLSIGTVLQIFCFVYTGLLYPTRNRIVKASRCGVGQITYYSSELQMVTPPWI